MESSDSGPSTSSSSGPAAFDSSKQEDPRSPAKKLAFESLHYCVG